MNINGAAVSLCKISNRCHHQVSTPWLQENKTWKFSEILRYKQITQPQPRICQLMDFAVPVNQRIKIKENEKLDKYPNLATELKKNITKH